MPDAKNTISVHVNIDITPASIEAVVDNAKKIVGSDAKGIYRVDTAEMLSKLISKFLLEKDFEAFSLDITNYIG